MSLVEEARAAAKKAQLARLAVKGSPEYPEIYAKQPEQIRLAAEGAAIRKVRRDAKALAQATAIADAAGSASVFEGAALTAGEGEG